jgi:hypothetical protein
MYNDFINIIIPKRNRNLEHKNLNLCLMILNSTKACFNQKILNYKSP